MEVYDNFKFKERIEAIERSASAGLSLSAGLFIGNTLNNKYSFNKVEQVLLSASVSSVLEWISGMSTLFWTKKLRSHIDSILFGCHVAKCTMNSLSIKPMYIIR